MSMGLDSSICANSTNFRIKRWRVLTYGTDVEANLAASSHQPLHGGEGKGCILIQKRPRAGAGACQLKAASTDCRQRPDKIR